jgi:small redox-active disulfide protein 2
MRHIEVLGPGCANCLKLELVASEAAREAGIEVEIRHITDYRQIASYGVMSTPGLVIDGVVASTGRIPSASEIAGWLANDVAASHA